MNKKIMKNQQSTESNRSNQNNKLNFKDSKNQIKGGGGQSLQSDTKILTNMSLNNKMLRQNNLNNQR